MKQVWMRVGLVTGVLSTGGTGVFMAQRYFDQEPAAGQQVAAAETTKPDSTRTPEPIPLPTSSFGSDSPAAPTSAVIRASDEMPLPPAEARYAEPAPPRPSTRLGSFSPAARTTIGDTETADSGQREGSAGELEGYVPVSGYGMESQGMPSASRYGEPASDSNLDEPRQLGDLPEGEQTETAEPLAADAADQVESPGARGAESNPSPVDGYRVTMPEESANPAATSGYGPPQELASGMRSGPATTPLGTSPARPEVFVGAGAVETMPHRFPPAATGAAPVELPAAGLAADVPGPRQLEGAQTPTLTLEKKAPGEVSVGQAAPFEIIVRNVGAVTAHGVVVMDRVPQGTELLATTPEAARLTNGVLAWQLGDLEPGDQATLTMELTPLVEGEIGSVAQVTFQAQASARTVSTKPELTVQQSGPQRVLIGEEVVFDIVLSNPGSGVATGVVLEEDVPDGLTHVAGRQLEYEVGTLRPKEEKRLRLILKADKAGVVQNVLRARGDAGLQSSDQAAVEVVAPQLHLEVAGPRTRYLERQVTYEIAVANPGTAAAYDIQLVAFLPKGLRFVAADHQGSYDQQRHAVSWSLAELPAQEMGAVHLTALPIEAGEQKLSVEGTGRLGIAAQFQHVTTVEALTELTFAVLDTQDPIEVGSETTYEIRVTNNGNKVATNVRIGAVLADDLTPLNGEGPSRVSVEGQQVLMEPLEKIAPHDEVVYRIAARGTRAGDHVIAVQLSCDDVPKPVLKQESTKVYSDQ